MNRICSNEAYLVDDNTMAIRGLLEDDRHKIEMKILFDIVEREVIDVRDIIWHHCPYPHCQEVTPLLKKLPGTKVGPGSSKRINSLIGNIEGCVHVVELVINIFKAFYQAEHRLADNKLATEEERVLRKTKMLKDECYGYKINAQRLGL